MNNLGRYRKLIASAAGSAIATILVISLDKDPGAHEALAVAATTIISAILVYWLPNDV